jgi:hypothetical protein
MLKDGDYLRRLTVKFKVKAHECLPNGFPDDGGRTSLPGFLPARRSSVSDALAMRRAGFPRAAASCDSPAGGAPGFDAGESVGQCVIKPLRGSK